MHGSVANRSRGSKAPSHESDRPRAGSLRGATSPVNRRNVADAEARLRHRRVRNAVVRYHLGALMDDAYSGHADIATASLDGRQRVSA
jgi:hypothetical protein